MRLCETQFYIDKEIKRCCWSIVGEQLDFNDEHVEIGDRLACKYCGQSFVLLMTEGQDRHPAWSTIVSE